MKSINILGLDVAQDEIVIYDKKLDHTVVVGNTEKALAEARQEYGWNPGQHLIALESTGTCSFLPMQYFVTAGFRTMLLNPIVTKRFTRATVRAKKTDISDAQAIARLAEQGEGREIKKNDLKITKKTLLRVESKLTRLGSTLKLMRQALDKKQESGIELSGAVNQIEHLIAETQKASQKILKLSRGEPVDRQEEIIASHIGCGEKLSAIISSEAGDLKRFENARQFKAYAGIDPRIYQSGTKCHTGKMTKRGNSYLRNALYLAAFVASMHDPELSVYYRKKRDEGKAHTHAVCTVARKLCERIYATVIQDRLYIPRYPQENQA